MTNAARVSVVVCTRNRPSALKRCVLSLIRQSHAPHEIIIVDDHSAEQALPQDWFAQNRRKSRVAKAPFKIRAIYLRNNPQAGLVASRNTGIHAASGEVIAFIDDDGFAHKDWLKRLMRHYHDRTIVGVGGPVIEQGRALNPVTSPVKTLASIRNGAIESHYRITDIHQRKYLSKCAVPFLQGGNMSFRRATLLRIHGGDVKFDGNYYREETDLGLKLSKLGTLIFDPDAFIYHKTAKTGGCRDIVRDDTNKFLYFMFKNTTYLFFKHFNVRKAARFTALALRTQIKLIAQHKTGLLTRPHFCISSRRHSIYSVVAGSLRGLYEGTLLRAGLLSRGAHPAMACSKHTLLACVEIVLIGGSIEIVKLESKTKALSKLLGI